MTDAIQAFNLTLPANGSSSAIFFTPCNLGPSLVSQIILNFPPGCSGLVNVRIESGGAQIYPLNAGTFFNFDDYALTIPVSNAIDSGSWHIAGYNTDFYPHTVSAYFFYDYIKGGSDSSGSILASL
jgi:hypothetical protein